MKAALAAVAVALVAGSADPIVVTRDSLELPAGCSPRDVAQTIERFFDAYNRRDLAALDRMFAPPRTESSSYVLSDGFKRRPTFRWYTTGNARVFDRERIRAHFAGQQDELQLRFVGMGKSWVLRSVGFTFFNVGDDAAFRRSLATDADVVPAVSAASSYRAGTGWTATALTPGPAAYRLLLADAGAVRIVFDCRSGLIRKWAGPVVRSRG